MAIKSAGHISFSKYIVLAAKYLSDFSSITREDYDFGGLNGHKTIIHNFTHANHMTITTSGHI